jgi:ketosteroid isomerase-like protein
MLGLALFLSACSGAPGGEGESRAQLLAMHEQVLEAHRTGDVERWMAVEDDDYVSANGGTITFPTTGERRAMREPYLLSTSFEVYRDLQDPIVEVSPDGQLGWVIAQVEMRGTQTSSDSSTHPIEAVWAWIELYRKVDGAWKLVGNVSNRQD